jgi:hypothetical protein
MVAPLAVYVVEDLRSTAVKSNTKQNLQTMERKTFGSSSRKDLQLRGQIQSDEITDDAFLKRVTDHNGFAVKSRNL